MCQDLFESNGLRLQGASFSECGKYRYSLWRIWNTDKPSIMFIGLNPSTANQKDDDPTIRRVCSIANSLGYGGVYMLNCWSYVSTDPKFLQSHIESKEYFTAEHEDNNLFTIKADSKKVKEIVFAWGSFDIVKLKGRDTLLHSLFPNAKALKINKDGSPKHPLYCRKDSKLIPYIEAYG